MVFKNLLFIKELCATIRDCWDGDAEARLTASCVHSRVQELQNKLAKVSGYLKSFTNNYFLRNSYFEKFKFRDQ